MSTARSDPLSALLELVRDAAREGAAHALAARQSAVPESAPRLVDKRGLAHALGVSSATIDRLCREGRIPFVRVGDVRRFDFIAVRAALDANVEPSTRPVPRPAKGARFAGVRLLSRGEPR